MSSVHDGEQALGWPRDVAEEVAVELRARMDALLPKVLVTSLAILVATAAVASLVGPRPVWQVYGVFTGLVLIATALERTGRARLAASVLCVGFWLTCSATILLLGGVRSPGSFVLVPLIVTTALFWSWNAAVGLTVASVAVEVAAAVLESIHRLPPPFQTPTSGVLLRVFVGSLAMTAVLSGLGVRALRGAMADAVTRSAALRTEAGSRRRFEAIGQLAGEAAHDFANLLTVITCSNDALAKGLPKDSPGRPYVDEIRDSAQQAVRLVRQLLSSGQSRAVGGIVCDIGTVVRRSLSLIERLVGPEVTLELTGDGEARDVRATESEIEQVLFSLAANARDAMPSGGRLVIEVGQRGDLVALVVTDTGAGMDEATRRLIVEPFLTTKPAGSDLGLATVRAIVQRRGGDLQVQSQPGCGSRFEVLLPSATA
jgi:signal transduction histidine kinase